MSPTLQAYVLDPLERAGRTFVQQFAVILLAVPAASLLITQNWVFAADSAGFAAAVSALTSILTFKVPVLGVWPDLVLRGLKTGLQSFVGTISAGQIVTISGADWKGALATAVPVALTALLTGLAAMGVPTTYGASLLPVGTGVAVDADDPDAIDTTDPDSTEGMFEPYDPDDDVVDADDDQTPAGQTPADQPATPSAAPAVPRDDSPPGA